MQAIITKQNAAGGYDSAGMNNRALISHLQSERGVLKWAAGYAGGRPHRVEFFANIYGEPFKTIERG
jgi:hypothetical protein